MSDITERLRIWERGGYQGDAQAMAVFASTDAREAADEIDRLRAALRFYADPASVYPGAEWPHGYPGGIVYRVGRDAIRDSGQIAIAALAP